MKNELLPIGSVVTVNNEDLMICSYMGKDSKIKDKHYDYACCLYPDGISEQAALINKEQIQRIKFIGFKNKRFYEYKKLFK
jgi:hypothetical protein